jgi:hypothetical protein
MIDIYTICVIIDAGERTMTTRDRVRAGIRVADEAWLAVAWLHRKSPDAPDFSIEEILNAAHVLRVNGDVRPGVYVHVVQHCVANRVANPANHRMLFETAPGRRRLFRLGDAAHPDRLNGRTAPTQEDLPSEYGDMMEWYKAWNRKSREGQAEEEDPLLTLRGSGKNLWADEHADEYVRRLREGWS